MRTNDGQRYLRLRCETLTSSVCEHNTETGASLRKISWIMAEMSRANDAGDTPEVIVATSFPSHHEIVLPKNEIIMDNYDVSSNVADKSHQDVDAHSHYEKINIHVEGPVVHSKPKSVYSLGGSNVKPKLELSSREVSTRQCKFEIGEEMEYFTSPTPSTAKHPESFSCPSSPVVGKRPDVSEAHDNPGYVSTETDNEKKKGNASDKSKEDFPFHYLFTSPSTSPSKMQEHHIIPNPYNKLNQRFHSTLQCPCFLFFFFLCCLPAVHFMQQSDHQFKKGNRKRASFYAKRSLIFYIIGSIVGVIFLSVAIFFAVEYVKQFV